MKKKVKTFHYVFNKNRLEERLRKLTDSSYVSQTGLTPRNGHSFQGRATEYMYSCRIRQRFFVQSKRHVLI